MIETLGGKQKLLDSHTLETILMSPEVSNSCMKSHIFVFCCVVLNLFVGILCCQSPLCVFTAHYNSDYTFLLANGRKLNFWNVSLQETFL